MTFQLTSFTMRFLSYLSMLLLAVSLTACGGGGGSAGTTSGAPIATLTTTAPSSLTVGIGASQTYTISGGRAPYTVSSSNAQVSIAGTKDNALTIGGIAPGVATLTVKDADAKVVSIAVTAANQPLVTSAPTAVTLVQGTQRSYSVSGGVPAYTAESGDSRIATISLSGTTLTITGVAVGSTSIFVRDASGTALPNIAVTVSGSSLLSLFTTAPSTVDLVLNKKATFFIGGGATPYLITSSKPAAVAVENSNTSVTVTGLSTTNKEVITSSGVTSISFEPATVVIRDSAGATLSFAVNVDFDPALKLAVSPAIATGNVGDSLIFVLSGGSAPYTLTLSKPGIATVSPISFATSGNTFTAVLNNVGATAVTITDALGQRINLSLTAENGASSLRLSPSILKLAEKGTIPIKLNIFGGTGPYTAFSSDTTLLTVGALTNNVVTVNPTPKDITTDTAVTITVVDSLGAAGTSIVTITNNNGP